MRAPCDGFLSKVVSSNVSAILPKLKGQEVALMWETALVLEGLAVAALGAYLAGLYLAPSDTYVLEKFLLCLTGLYSC